MIKSTNQQYHGKGDEFMGHDAIDEVHVVEDPPFIATPLHALDKVTRGEVGVQLMDLGALQ